MLLLSVKRENLACCDISYMGMESSSTSCRMSYKSIQCNKQKIITHEVKSQLKRLHRKHTGTCQHTIWALFHSKRINFPWWCPPTYCTYCKGVSWKQLRLYTHGMATLTLQLSPLSNRTSMGFLGQSCLTSQPQTSHPRRIASWSSTLLVQIVYNIT